jgi:hypothetical protein
VDHVGKTFIEQTIAIDEDTFEDCFFARCTLVYRGNRDVRMKNCSFESPRYFFDGAAKETIGFLTDLYHGGCSVMVEGIFDAIRSNVNPPPFPDKDSVH